MKRLLLIAVLVMTAALCPAQMYNGMTGYIHIPSAEMNAPGTIRGGAHYINKALMPDRMVCPNDEGVKEKYNSFSYYINLTPFSWMEVAYTCVSFKMNEPNERGYTRKDRHFALKFRPLKEGKYWPALAIGGDDLIGSSWKNGQWYFANAWISATKHFDIKGHELGLNLGYRYYLADFNKKYNKSPFAAITYRPAFAPDLRFMVEWDGVHVNYGLDAVLFEHLVVQLAFTDGTGFCGGVALQMDLLNGIKRKSQK